jgi:hypothetical protein
VPGQKAEVTMTYQKTWQDFGQANVWKWEDSDHIDLVDEAGTAGRIEFVLRTDPSGQHADWWRALALVDNSTGTQFAIVEIDKSNMGPSTMSDTVERLGNAFINIQKAKAFGVHTGMYDLRNLTEKAGRRITFIWRRFG